ncbi:HEPN domain-containing protein [Curtobacterium sp. NPDC089689]|uniref:ApeA N-terminal domain 1-containing protein n=1 Tax=Curtobacterium sp. NPDC089689 TaxID=3363968 RepID=UPI00380E7658
MTDGEANDHEPVAEAALSEPGEWTGFWWIPSEPDAKHPGVLHFDPMKGVELRLIGGWEYETELPEVPGLSTGQLKEWAMVHGAVADGTPVTLLHLHVSTVTRSNNRFKRSDAPDHLHLQAGVALLGCHLPTSTEPAFVGVSATVEHLTTWSARSGIHRTYKQENSCSREVHLEQLSALQAEFDDLTITLDHWNIVSSGASRSRRRTSVEEYDAIQFSTALPQPLDRWLDLVASAADLMSLTTMSASAVIGVRLFLPATPDAFPADHPTRNQRREVQLLQHRVTHAQPNLKAELHHHFLLTLDDMDFAVLMPRWLAIRERFAAARGMILGLQYVPSGYIENRVVTAVAAAEALHRALAPDPPIPPQSFRQLRRDLLDRVDPAHKQWLSERLTSTANVPTLRERLLELANRLGGPGSALVGDVHQWATAAKNARNRIAHLGSAEEDFLHLHAVIEVTSGVVILNLLHELGLPSEHLERSVLQHPKLSYAAHLARTHLSGAPRAAVRETDS